MFQKKAPEVMVVGAGPVGLYSAAALAQKGTRVQIIDQGWRPASHSYALALHPSSLRLLMRRGLPRQTVSNVHRISGVGIYDAHDRKATIDFSKLDTEFNYIGVLPQKDLEEGLENVLQAHGIPVKWNHRLSQLQRESDDCVRVTIDRMTRESLGYAVAQNDWVVSSSREVDVPYVIGTDGHSSMVRRALGIDFENAGPTRYFAVVEFLTHSDLKDEMRVVLGENTTDVFWPLSARRCRWSFELTDFAAPPATRHKDRFLIQREEVLTEGEFGEMIQTRAPWFDGKVEKLEWSTLVRFEQRLATRFGEGRTWLAGDAAHMALPIAVQSMNVGFTEADELTEAIAAGLGGAGDDAPFDAYGKTNLARWRGLLGLEGDNVSYARDATPWIRRHARRIATAIPASGEDRRELLAQVGLHLSTSDTMTYA